MASQMNKLLRKLRNPTRMNPIRAGIHPALCATRGRLTAPGPVLLHIKRQSPPQKVISLTTVGTITPCPLEGRLRIEMFAPDGVSNTSSLPPLRVPEPDEFSVPP